MDALVSFHSFEDEYLGLASSSSSAETKLVQDIRREQAFKFLYDRVSDAQLKVVLTNMRADSSSEEGVAREAWRIICHECGGPCEDHASLISSLESTRRDLYRNVTERDWPLRMSGLASWV